MTRFSILALLLLVGCNNDGSFHMPLSGPDNTLSPAMKQRLADRMAECDKIVPNGGTVAQAAYCRQVMGAPETGGGQTYTFCSGMCSHMDTVTVYGP